MKYALYILTVFILFSFINAQPNVFIKNVPDYSQPPDSTIPSSIDITNYCAPYAFLNVLQYWDSIQVQPFARGLMGGLPAKDIVEYIGWFMDTNNQGNPARHNGTTLSQAKGTYVLDQWEGAEEFILFDASNTFLFPYTVPAQKNRYAWDIQLIPVPNFSQFQNEINTGNPLKLDFKYWNIMPTGGFIFNPELAEDTIFVYDWGAIVDQSGSVDERDPLEYWNLAEGDAGIGHAVTAVGYLENYVPPDTSYVIVHDNWANTPKNIAVPWIDANITGWYFYHLSDPPDLAVTNIQTANDTSLGFTDSLQIHKPATVAVTIHNLGSGGVGAGQYMCTTSVLDPLGSPVITHRKYPQTILYPEGAGQDSTFVYFDSLFTPTMTGGYEITSIVYWDMNGDSLENDSPDLNRSNDTLVVTAQVYVRTNLPLKVTDDFATIQEAIDASSDGNTVLVDEGTYYENINFKGKAITVASYYSMDSNPARITNTTIDGSKPVDTLKASVVTFDSGEDTTSVLIGFTVTGGSGSDIIESGTRDGGGILINGSGAKIVHNIITDNIINTGLDNRWSAGIAAYGESGTSIIIRDNRITNNKIISDIGGAAGIGIWTKGNVLIENNTVRNNTCTVTNAGWSGGILIDGTNGANGKSILVGNLIQNNVVESSQWYAFGGGLMIQDVSPDLIRNIISGNTSSSYGGGVHIRQMYVPMHVRLIHNTITENEGATGGGLGIHEEAVIEVVNSIIWDNTASSSDNEIFRQGLEDLIIKFSDIKGGWEGKGNIDKDPYFTNVTYHDYSLTDSSLCIDSGIDTTFSDVNPQYYKSYNGNAPDIGALESPYFRTGIENMESILPKEFALHQNHPNPFNPKTVISWQLPVSSQVNLSVYNILGEKVATMVNKKQPAGIYNVEWDASGFPSGVYIYRLKTKDFNKSNKMILLK